MEDFRPLVTMQGINRKEEKTAWYSRKAEHGKLHPLTSLGIFLPLKTE